MQHFDYKPHGVCPMNISFDLDGDTVHNVSFKGGCNGIRQSAAWSRHDRGAD
ncbi:MAG: TSCPD domain-containing protein [Butyricicoccus sp.]